MRNKKQAPEPRRRNSDIESVDEILICSTIVFCIMGAIFLILGGLGL